MYLITKQTDVDGKDSFLVSSVIFTVFGSEEQANKLVQELILLDKRRAELGQDDV